MGSKVQLAKLIDIDSRIQFRSFSGDHIVNNQ